MPFGVLRSCWSVAQQAQAVGHHEPAGSHVGEHRHPGGGSASARAAMAWAVAVLSFGHTGWVDPIQHPNPCKRGLHHWMLPQEILRRQRRQRRLHKVPSVARDDVVGPTRPRSRSIRQASVATECHASLAWFCEPHEAIRAEDAGSPGRSKTTSRIMLISSSSTISTSACSECQPHARRRPPLHQQLLRLGC